MPSHRQCVAVSRNTMKPAILTVILLISISSYCQETISIDSSSVSIDSIFSKLNPILSKVREHYFDVPDPSYPFKTLVTNYKDSITFLFCDTSGSLLFKKIDKYEKSGCRLWETIEVFSLTGKLYYREGWKWSCSNTNQKRDPEIKYLDAVLYERERFIYYKDGRIKSRIWWYAPLGLREYRYTYNNDKIESEVIRKESERFWE
jgi:hypothetical protein